MTILQAACMLISSLVVVIVGEHMVGGPGKVFDVSYHHARIEIFNMDLSLLTRHTFWSQTVGGYFTWMTIYAINQTMIQRYLTVKDLRYTTDINTAAVECRPSTCPGRPSSPSGLAGSPSP